MFAMDCGRALTPPPSFVRNRQDVASAPLSYELHALYTIQHNPLECLVSLPQELPLQTQPLQIHHHTYPPTNDEWAAAEIELDEKRRQQQAALSRSEQQSGQSLYETLQANKGDFHHSLLQTCLGS